MAEHDSNVCGLNEEGGRRDFSMVVDSGKAVDPPRGACGHWPVINGATTLKGLICDHGCWPM